MAKKKNKQIIRPWCWYCEREFEDEKVLMQHQKAKHFKCNMCPRRLNTAGGLAVHIQQVHKLEPENLPRIDNALPGRDGYEVEIFGMEGIPAPDVADYKRRKEIELGLSAGSISQPPAKRPKIENRPLTEEELKAQLEAHKALMGGGIDNTSAGGQSAADSSTGGVYGAPAQAYAVPPAPSPGGMGMPPPPGMMHPGGPPPFFPGGPPPPGVFPGQPPPFPPPFGMPGFPPGPPPPGFPIPPGFPPPGMMPPGATPPFPPPPGGMRPPFPPPPGFPMAPPFPGQASPGAQGPQGSPQPMPPPQQQQQASSTSPAAPNPPTFHQPTQNPSQSPEPGSGHAPMPPGPAPAPALVHPTQPTLPHPTLAQTNPEFKKKTDLKYPDPNFSPDEKRAFDPKYYYAKTPESQYTHEESRGKKRARAEDFL